MEIESYLTDVYGPRLTGSPNIKEAADWAQKTMKDWGLVNVHLETWPFGRGWQNQRFVAMRADAARVSAHRLPESVDAGHQRPGHRRSGARGDRDREGLRHVPRQAARQVRARRRAMRDVPAHFEAPGHRYTDAELADLSKQPEAAAAGGGRGNFQAAQAFTAKRTQFFIDEGVAAVLDLSRGDGGTLFVQGGGSRDPKDPPVAAAGRPRRRALRPHRRARSRRTSRSRCRCDIENTFYDADLNAFNVDRARFRAPTRPTRS